MPVLTDIEKLDVVDLIIAVLRDHEKNFDRLMERLEKFTDRTLVEGFSYGQALKAVRAQANTVKSLTHDVSMRHIAIQNFIQALNRWELIPSEWVSTLIRVGIESLKEIEDV